MSEGSTTESNETNTDSQNGNSSNTPANNTPPAQQSTPPANNTPSADFTALTTLLTALPEQIAKSVKEAVGTPAKPTTENKTTENKSQESKPAENAATAEKGKAPGETEGKTLQQRFANWWTS